MDQHEEQTNNTDLAVIESSDTPQTEEAFTSGLAALAVTPASDEPTTIATPASPRDNTEDQITPAIESSVTSAPASAPMITLRFLPHDNLRNVYTGRFNNTPTPTNIASPVSAGDLEIEIAENEKCPICTELLSDATDSYIPGTGAPGDVAYHSVCRKVLHTDCLIQWADGQPVGRSVRCPWCRGMERGPRYDWDHPSAATIAASTHRWNAAAAATAAANSQEGEDVEGDNQEEEEAEDANAENEDGGGGNAQGEEHE